MLHGDWPIRLGGNIHDQDSQTFDGYVSRTAFSLLLLLWGCCSATEIQHLQRLQNRAAIIVTNGDIDAAIKPILQR